MGLEEIFSEQNILAYAGACLDLAVKVPESRMAHNFDTLVIPSRGAVPFFLGMTYALDEISQLSSDHNQFYEDLGVQSLIAPLLPEKSKVARSISGKDLRVLLVPFTADLNIEKYDSKEDNTEFTTKTRKYWANVTASFLEPSQKRMNDPYFRSFTDVVLKEIEQRQNVAEAYENFPQIKRFSLIDTVISGRAASDILRAFDELSVERKNEDLLPDAFLIIDESGAKLKPEFLRYLRKYEVEGQIKSMYPIPRIVSEDEGASLLGVSAVVYPSIMKASKELYVGEKPFFVGAGSWRLDNELGGRDNVYASNFNRFMNLVYRAIDAKYVTEFQGKAESNEMDAFRQERTDFIKYGNENRILGKHDAETAVLKLSPKYHIEGAYETGSHVVHVPFNKNSTHDLVTKLQSIAKSA